VIAILLGGIIGGWLSRTSNGMPTSIWAAATVKGCIAIAWIVWPDEKPKVEDKS
jgi:predicted MFS family arabinose efflux permease